MTDQHHCTDCTHAQEHSTDMTWCAKRGRVQQVGKPLECDKYKFLRKGSPGNTHKSPVSHRPQGDGALTQTEVPL